MAGQPKKFKSGNELIDLFNEFCQDVKEQGFTSIPSQTNFCSWLSKKYKSIDRRTIYNSLNLYFPNIKKDFEKLQGDIIAEGGMLGMYQPAMSIFALKNWCKWKDKHEDDDKQMLDKLDEVLAKIGE